MKALLIAAMLVLSTAAFATDASSSSAPTAPGAASGGNAKSFADVKKARLEHIQAKIDMYQKAQTCVQAAADFKAMQACWPQGKGYHHHNSGNWHHHDAATTAPDAPAPNSQ